MIRSLIIFLTLCIYLIAKELQCTRKIPDGKSRQSLLLNIHFSVALNKLG